jgi:hypothetical protein
VAYFTNVERPESEVAHDVTLLLLTDQDSKQKRALVAASATKQTRVDVA